MGNLGQARVGKNGLWCQKIAKNDVLFVKSRLAGLRHLKPPQYLPHPRATFSFAVGSDEKPDMRPEWLPVRIFGQLGSDGATQEAGRAGDEKVGDGWRHGAKGRNGEMAKELTAGSIRPGQRQPDWEPFGLNRFASPLCQPVGTTAGHGRNVGLSGVTARRRQVGNVKRGLYRPACRFSLVRVVLSGGQAG